LMLSQQKQCPDLQEKLIISMISHLMALSSSRLREGKRCKNFLSKVTHLGFLLSGNLEVETCSSDHTSSTPHPHGSLGSREQAYPPASPQRASKESVSCETTYLTLPHLPLHPFHLISQHSLQYYYYY
uniref:Uncharacterized protein n=1 Tax=Catharus ustulatus TaxID=91951 RepID=A0A8C3TZR6_CATUS